MASEMDLDFEWDEDKAVANLKKQKISFEEAKTVFADPFAITIDDPKHSLEEHRFIDNVCRRKSFGCFLHRTRAENSAHQLPQSHENGTQNI